MEYIKGEKIFQIIKLINKNKIIPFDIKFIGLKYGSQDAVQAAQMPVGPILLKRKSKILLVLIYFIISHVFKISKKKKNIVMEKCKQMTDPSKLNSQQLGHFAHPWLMSYD